MIEPIRIHISNLADDEHKVLLTDRYGEEIVARMAAHKARIDRAWATIGPACKPFQSSPSTVPAAADLSRVVAAEHGGSVFEVRS